jgi:hypothetical protein
VRPQAGEVSIFNDIYARRRRSDARRTSRRACEHAIDRRQHHAQCTIERVALCRQCEQSDVVENVNVTYYQTNDSTLTHVGTKCGYVLCRYTRSCAYQLPRAPVGAKNPPTCTAVALRMSTSALLCAISASSAARAGDDALAGVSTRRLLRAHMRHHMNHKSTVSAYRPQYGTHAVSLRSATGSIVSSPSAFTIVDEIDCRACQHEHRHVTSHL